MVKRPMLCTGGPNPAKHCAQCTGEVTREARCPQPLQFDQCRNSSHFRITSVRGNYACSQRLRPQYLFHCPSLDISLARERDFFMHASCACNNWAAFRRVALCVPRPEAGFVEATLFPIADRLAMLVGKHQQIPFSSVIQRYSGKKAHDYWVAAGDLQNFDGQAQREHSKIKMFVKKERTVYKETKVNPECRAIQFRDRRFTLEFMSLIVPSEHVFYNLHDVPGFGFGRIFAKSRNPRQRGADLRGKYDHLAALGGGPVKILLLDAHRWDAHVNVDLLRVEERFYARTSRHPRRVREMCRWQQHNRCSFRSGEYSVNYTVDGERMSGDANTAYGNCLLMGTLIAAFCEHLQLEHFTIYDDGDDSVLMYLGPDVADQDVNDFFLRAGVEMAVEGRPTEFEHIDFCQSRPVQLADGWCMVRDPRKLLAAINVSHKLRDPKHRASYISTVCKGEASLVRGCPVLQAVLGTYIEALDAEMSSRQRKRISKLAIADNYRMSQWLPSNWTQKVERPVTTTARRSFANAWDISVEQQMRYEATPSKAKRLLGKEVVGQGMNLLKWEYPWIRPEQW